MHDVNDGAAIERLVEAENEGETQECWWECILAGLAALVADRLELLQIIERRLSVLLPMPTVDMNLTNLSRIHDAVRAAMNGVHEDTGDKCDELILRSLLGALKDGELVFDPCMGSNSDEHTTCPACGFTELVPELKAVGADWECPKCGAESIYGFCTCEDCFRLAQRRLDLSATHLR